MNKKEIFKENLKSIIIGYFNEKVSFNYLQDNFIDYADKYSISTKKLDKLRTKCLYYYNSIKDLEELPPYTEQEKKINKLIKIID